jgi:hypothetical protein
MRRTCATRVHGTLSRSERGELAAQIKTIQEWIASVDEAIDDEKKLKAEEPEATAGSMPPSAAIVA